jgi:type I restriction enzyme S subunit
MDFEEREREDFRLRVGNVLVCEGGEVGRAAVWHGELDECYFQKALHRLRPDPARCLPEFLQFQFSVLAKSGQLAEYTSHATISHLTGVKLAGLRIPLPSLDEQRRIVDLLDRAAGIRRLRRQAQDTASELIPALFTKTFGDPATNPMGWPVVSFGTLMSGCDYGSSEKASGDSSGTPIIRMGNVTAAGYLDLRDIKYLNQPPQALSKFALQSGDLLFNRTNSKDLVGKMGLWDGRMNAVAASYFIRIRLDILQALPEYILAFFNSSHMKRRLFATARGAIGQANINMKELRAFSVPVPPITLQHEFRMRTAEIGRILSQQAAAAYDQGIIAASLSARLLA